MMCWFASGNKARERSQQRLPVRNSFHFRSSSVAQPEPKPVLSPGTSSGSDPQTLTPHHTSQTPSHARLLPSENSPQVIHDDRRTEREKYYRAEPHRAHSGNPRRKRTPQAGPDL